MKIQTKPYLEIREKNYVVKDRDKFIIFILKEKKSQTSLVIPKVMLKGFK